MFCFGNNTSIIIIIIIASILKMIIMILIIIIIILVLIIIIKPEALPPLARSSCSSLKLCKLSPLLSQLLKL